MIPVRWNITVRHVQLVQLGSAVIRSVGHKFARRVDSKSVFRRLAIIAITSSIAVPSLAQDTSTPADPPRDLTVLILGD